MFATKDKVRQVGQVKIKFPSRLVPDRTHITPSVTAIVLERETALVPELI